MIWHLILKVVFWAMIGTIAGAVAVYYTDRRR